MVREQLAGNDVAIGDRVCGQNQVLMRFAVRAKVDLPRRPQVDVALSRLARQWATVKDFDEGFGFQLVGDDVAGLRNDHQPVVVGHRRGSVARPRQVRRELWQQFGRRDGTRLPTTLRDVVAESLCSGLSLIAWQRANGGPALEARLGKKLTARLRLRQQLVGQRGEGAQQRGLVDRLRRQSREDGAAVGQWLV